MHGTVSSDGEISEPFKIDSGVKQGRVLALTLFGIFADDAALVSHTQEGIQCLVDRLLKSCKEFSLTVSIKKTEIMAQDAEIPSFNLY